MTLSNQQRQDDMPRLRSVWTGIIRWILVLPGAATGALVATAIIAALNMIGPESWQATAGEIQKSAISGMVFVFAGAFIALSFPPSVGQV